MLKKVIKSRLGLLMDPKEGFLKQRSQKFEKSVHEYLLLLVTLGIVAGLVSFIWAIAKAFYYDMMYEVDIKYNFLINYAIGNATGLMFFYIFTGTFILFFISMVLNIFIRMRYVKLLHIIFLAMTPLLLFAWLPFLTYTLVFWSLFLMISGLRVMRKDAVKKDSIEQRD